MTKLEWHGPLVMSGATPSPALAELRDAPGVYIYYQQYADKTVIYVGQSRNLWTRIFDHIGSFASGKYWLRDEVGDWAYHPMAGKQEHMRYGNLARFVDRPWADLPALIQDNLNRLVFIWAPLKGKLNNTEKSLIEMARGCSAVECDNDHPGTGDIIALTHNFDNLKGLIAPEISALLSPTK